MTVDRCVCSDVPFTTVKRLAAEGLTFDQITRKTGCCLSCGLCEPYVRDVIHTGRTSLPVLYPSDTGRMKRAASRAGKD